MLGSWRVTASAVSAAAVMLAAVACGGGEGGGSPAGKPTVIGAFYPMAWVAQRVGGGDVTVETLTRPGTEPHDLELNPHQVLRIGKAKLVVYVSGVQPAVDDAVRDHARTQAVDALALVKTLPAGSSGGGEQAGGGARPDPHLWLDPTRLATVATAVGERLAASDPGHAAAYRANARTLAGDLAALDGRFRAGLSRCGQKVIVTSHSAFAYLADRYGLTQIPVAGVDPEREPSPKRLAELTGEVRRYGVTTVFTETLVSSKVADTLAGEAGVRTATLDPLEGAPPGGQDYLSAMRRNLETLRTALECR